MRMAQRVNSNSISVRGNQGKKIKIWKVERKREIVFTVILGKLFVSSKVIKERPPWCRSNVPTSRPE
jgi:hypothetical protein